MFYLIKCNSLRELRTEDVTQYQGHGKCYRVTDSKITRKCIDANIELDNLANRDVHKNDIGFVGDNGLK